MKIFSIYLLLSFLVCATSSAQYATSSSKSPKKAGDLIESTSYNDHRRGAPRTLQYLPDGEDFVCVNGKNRYTRALYGSPTAWRLETSDRPIFATYVKRDSRNIRFRLRLPDGTLTPLEETSWCEARYKPGSRSYRLTDNSWGKDASLEIIVLASPTEESALWAFSGSLPPGCVIEALNSPIRKTKLSRSGDMGADPPGCFDPAEDGTVLQTLECPLLAAGETTYIGISDNRLKQIDNPALFREWEQARDTLARRIRILTPDPYFNTLGGALATAADGIWGTEGVWLHGAVGWRMPLSGWRAGYTGDALGWHDRARTHFDNYAASQVTEVPCTRRHPAQDSALALARSVKEWGTPQYSNGYICRNPRRNNQMHHYDMNLCYIDELLWHFNWTGDLDYARRLWPVLTLHLAWEKRNFDPDNDGLYDAYACIWASDALYYNSGAVTHSSAYNYRANRMAALIASKIGEDPEPYRREADKILTALNARLWLSDKGHWAEFQDFMGHKRLHPNAAVWTIYHAIDSDVADPFQAYLATRYVDRELPHIPVVTSPEALPAGMVADWRKRVEAAGAEVNAGDYATVATTNWMPYSWSINNVAFAEVMHTALAYFQAGRRDAGYKLLKSSVLDGMYLGDSPGNFGQISFYDAARGECYRDFGDPIGIASRVLIQGLYGILPDALNGRLLLKPGFPSDWEYASLHTPDIDFDFRNEESGGNEELRMKNEESLVGSNAQPDSSFLIPHSSFTAVHRLPAVKTLELQIPARRSCVARLLVNGKAAPWKLLESSVGHPMLSVSVPASSGEQVEISIAWEGEPIAVPTRTDSLPASRIRKEGPVDFVAMEQGQMKWWAPVERRETLQANSAANTSGPAASSSCSAFDNVVSAKCEAVTMDAVFNANVTDIFRNEYLSPRSPYTTLQIPKQGIGEWCHPLKTANIDDSGLRAAVRGDSDTSKGGKSRSRGLLQTKLGIPFRTPAEGPNIAFTSLWDNYPDSLRVPLKGKASRAYLLMAGSTNHMQCHIDNGIIRVYYKDGSCDTLPLVNPDNWPPIEQIFFEDGKAFNRHAPSLYRLRLKTAEVSNRFGEELGFPGVSREIDGGAAVLLEMPLDKNKSLSHLVLETLSNEVVIGLMGVTLQR